MSKTRPYREALLTSLADPVEAKLYLKAVLEDYPEGFLKALRNVAQANEMTKVAKAAGVKRETLYRSLSDQGNPTLETLRGVLSAVGLKLSLETCDPRAPHAIIDACANQNNDPGGSIERLHLNPHGPRIPKRTRRMRVRRTIARGDCHVVGFPLQGTVLVQGGYAIPKVSKNRDSYQFPPGGMRAVQNQENYGQN